jgi:hypothetical protein
MPNSAEVGIMNAQIDASVSLLRRVTLVRGRVNSKRTPPPPFCFIDMQARPAFDANYMRTQDLARIANVERTLCRANQGHVDASGTTGFLLELIRLLARPGAHVACVRRVLGQARALRWFVARPTQGLMVTTLTGDVCMGWASSICFFASALRTVARLAVVRPAVKTCNRLFSPAVQFSLDLELLGN